MKQNISNENFSFNFLQEDLKEHARCCLCITPVDRVSFEFGIEESWQWLK
jgi:hypothetical protein